MRHGVKLKKLGRGREHRRAMMNNLATSILLKGMDEEQMNRQVRTTSPRAKAVRSLVERLITYAKKGDLSARRQAARFVKSPEVLKGLFSTLGERYKDREGGYTRVLKISENRHGDNAEMSIITLVEDELVKKPKKKAKSSKKKASVKKEVEKAEEAVETVEKPAKATEKVAEAKETKPKAEAKKEEKKDSK